MISLFRSFSPKPKKEETKDIELQQVNRKLLRWYILQIMSKPWWIIYNLYVLE